MAATFVGLDTILLQTLNILQSTRYHACFGDYVEEIEYREQRDDYDDYHAHT